MFWITLIIGLAGTAVALALAGRRVLFLWKLFKSGQPDPERVLQVKRDPKADARGQLVEVLGQRKLLKWTVAGSAHFAVMWAFLLLVTVYLEALERRRPSRCCSAWTSTSRGSRPGVRSGSSRTPSRSPVRPA